MASNIVCANQGSDGSVTKLKLEGMVGSSVTGWFLQFLAFIGIDYFILFNSEEYLFPHFSLYSIYNPIILKYTPQYLNVKIPIMVFSTTIFFS